MLAKRLSRHGWQLPAACWQWLCAGMRLRLVCRGRWWFLQFKPPR